MHLEDRVMSAPLNGGKPIFPVPLAGQPLMFASGSCQSNFCEQSRSLHPLSPKLGKTRCSCDNNNSSLTMNSHYNRLLLPAVSHKEPTSATSPSSYQDSWLRLRHIGRSNYESLVLNGFSLYGRVGNENFPSLDYALLSNARRKNATRETTSTLKAWLNDHKKNPYPTKGEKVMLAIVTKMTLTQVSTWFANARRRLKKENKMTWLPKKKSGEKKDNKDSGDSCNSDSDEGEDMDVDVSIDDAETCVKSKFDTDLNLLLRKDTLVETEMKDVSQPIVAPPKEEIQRPSVIRAVEPPTFNQIKARFEDNSSPVHSLQNWVNGCFKEPFTDLPEARQLTPPTTPIENQVTTFSEQKLFEIFDANKNKNNFIKPAKSGSSFSDDPLLGTLFSSKQPVCSTKETFQTKSEDAIVIPSVITPQPSPKNMDSEFFKKKQINIVTEKFETISREVKPLTKEEEEEEPRNDFKNSKSEEKAMSEPAANVRVQGLTTSRELEAVMALTNLYKT